MLSSLPRYALIALLVASVVCGVYAMTIAVERTHVTHAIDYEEGNVLNAAVRINHGLTPYPDPQTFPVVLNPYGPIPYYLTAIPVHFAGPNLAAPRMIIVIASLSCAIFLGLIIATNLNSVVIGLAFGALFLANTVVQFWIPILRVDLIGLAFELAGLYVFVRFKKLWPLALILFTCALFTKPTFVAAPLACFLFLILQKQKKQALKFALSGTALCGLVLATLQLCTHGTFFFDVLGSHPDPIAWWHVSAYGRLLFFSSPALILLAMVGVITLIQQRNLTAPLIYALLTLILGSITILKLGSNDNHLIEMVVGLLILGSYAFRELTNSSSSIAKIAATALALAIAAWSLLQMPFVPRTPQVPGCAAAYAFVGQQPSDRILSEDIGAVVTNGKTAWVSNPYVYAQLAETGKLSDAPLQQRINSRWFDMILVENLLDEPTDRWSPTALDAMRRNYHSVGRFTCKAWIYVYLPNQQ